MSIIRTGISDTDLDVPVASPTLNLDFANSQKLDPRITFTRGSIGTFVNKNGLIETAQANIPRFDYDPISGECRGLLIEESRTNLISSSNSFGGGSVDLGITASATTSPDGSVNASKIFEKATNGYKIYTAGVTIVAGTTYCGSVFVKSGERATMYFKITQSGDAVNGTLTFNMRTGRITGTGGSPVNYGVIPHTNGWYRIYITFTPTVTTGQLQLFVRNDTSGTLTYQGDGSSGYYFYGMQVEAGTFPTSYIPTSGSTVTRTAELVLMTGTNFSSWYNQTEGTFFFDGTLPFITNDTITRVPFGVSNGLNFPNSMYASKISTSLGVAFSVVNNNVGQVSGTNGANMTSSNFKIAASVAPRSVYISHYGGILNASRASAAIPTVDRLSLGKEPWNAGALNPIIGCIRKFTYYPKALSPSQLRYLTI